MYIRLKNLPDLESLKEEFISRQSEKLYDCIKEDLSTLDAAYRTDRSIFAYGGYVILIADIKSRVASLESLCNTYHLSSDEYEYLDDVWEDTDNGIQWKKMLFILGGDENLLVYFPEQMVMTGAVHD